MEDFCGSELWDSQLTWNTTDPYFTPCFETSVLKVIPAGFLFLFGISDVINIKSSKFKSKTFYGSFTWISTLKAVFILLLALLQLIEIIRLEAERSSLSTPPLPADFLSPSLQLVAHVAILALSLLTQYNLVDSCGVQFFYWLLLTFTQAICFRTAIIHFDVSNGTNSKEEIVYLTTLISFPIILIRFFLEFLNNATCSTQNHGDKLGKPSPELQSSFIGKLLFFWYDSFAWTGYRRSLNKDDLWDLTSADTSHEQIENFTKCWNKEAEKVASKPPTKSGEKRLPGVWTPLLKCYGPAYVHGLFLKLSSDMLVFVQPTMLSYLVAHVTNPEHEPSWKGYFYATSICLTFLVQTGLNATASRRVFSVALQARAALSTAVFRKGLVLSSASKRESSMGGMVNLLSVDSQKLVEFLPFLALAFGGPFQVMVCVVLLYNTLGVSIFAGVSILISLVPVNLYLVAVTRKYQIQQMRLKDDRLKLTSEVLGGIKVLKLYAWEPAFQTQIENIRQKEMKCLRRIAVLNVISGFIFQATPAFVSLTSFATFVYSSTDNVLNAQNVFVSINLFNIMRFPMILLPLAFSTAMQTSVSMNRLSTYFNMEELNKSSVTHEESYSDPIVMKDATLSWSSKNETTLRNINFNVKKGELVAIVGTIGSGKTSLLASLLGDLEKHSGVINTQGDIAYVSQSAWIQNASLRNNILFGDKYKEAKYKNTISACALETDLQILASGDQTEIGEKGMNLSGGQKQRVALARAAYKDASVYLFDDPLSAVDSHVGKHIFEHLIGSNGILQKKTRILVTHAISFLPRVDRIFVMKNGEISESGTYKELMQQQGEFAEFLLTHLGTGNDEETDPDAISVVQDLEGVVGVDAIRRRSTSNRESLAKVVLRQSIPGKGEVKKAAGAPKLIQEELAAEGNIKLSIFLDYFKSAGITLSILTFVFSFIGFGLVAVSNIWLSRWSTQATIDEEATGTTVQATTDKYMLGYAIIAFALVLGLFSALWTLALVTLAASKILHARALTRVLRSPMSYFDTTLLGRIINRFSRDVDTLDNIIPINIRTFLAMGFNVFFIILVISYTLPEFIAFIIPIIIVYVFLQRFYTSTSRQLKRLEGISRSPIFSHFGETISGSSIIRAFRMEEDFIMESEKRIDDNQKSYYPFIYSSIWVSVRLEFLGLLIIIATCLFVLLSRTSIAPGQAGLAISYSLQITTFLNFLARQISDLEANIVSAERLGELTETPQEPAWEKSDSKLSPSWPQNGQIIFEKYMTRYREGLDLVLKGISCRIEPGEKIGVVGRTGAGKSSLTLALFRIIESSSGSILIDGIDISTLGLHDLRKKITIIPQDPVLFSGSLRLNLDPFNEYSDDQVWRCLELAHLKGYVISLKDGLFEMVEEEGQNLSVGQRQLICLARALLRKTKILVLDEATAAVDLETDDLIQATIRKEFMTCTVITIAHRLNTIVDSTRVMVLDKGEIREFDSPQVLLADTKSIFWAMAKDAKIV